jgi:hypothetical protein
MPPHPHPHLNSRISLASAASTGRLNATMPPNAEMGSARTASRYASRRSARVATPQGLVCLTMTQVGSWGWGWGEDRVEIFQRC